MARNYSTTDEYMVERSETLQSVFGTEAAADFVAFDPELDAAFNTAWLDAIQAAIAAVSGETVGDQIIQLTQLVEEKMRNCKKKYVEVKYFFEKAFPGNVGVMKEMGADDYEVARKSQIRLIFFMESMHVTAEKYKTQLIAKGYTQARIDEIGTLKTELQTANKNQNKLLKTRPVLTQDRELIYNTCYDFTKRVCDAAQIVYYDDEVKRNFFVFESVGGQNTEFFDGTVADGEKKQVDDFTYSGNMKFAITNTGTIKLAFYFGLGAVVPTGNIFELQPGESIEKLASEFSAAGDSLWVEGVGTGGGGAYEVEETI